MPVHLSAGVASYALRGILANGLFGPGESPGQEFRCHLSTTYPGRDPAATYADFTAPDPNNYAPKLCVPYVPHSKGAKWLRLAWITPRPDGAFSGRLTWLYTLPAPGADEIRGWFVTPPDPDTTILCHGPIDPPIPDHSLLSRVDLQPRMIVGNPRVTSNLLGGGEAGCSRVFANKALELLRTFNFTRLNDAFPAWNDLRAVLYDSTNPPDPDFSEKVIQGSGLIGSPVVPLVRDHDEDLGAVLRVHFRAAADTLNEPGGIRFASQTLIRPSGPARWFVVLGKLRSALSNSPALFYGPVPDPAPLGPDLPGVVLPIALDLRLAGV